jgi:hypothetical protein
MKIALIIITLFSSVLAQALETSTECPMMKDSHGRSNPKVMTLQSKAKSSMKGKASSQ